MNLPSRLSVLSISLLIAACSYNRTPPQSGLEAPKQWQGPSSNLLVSLPQQQWWQQFSSAPLNRLIAHARHNSFDLAAAVARVRQAQASAVIAGAPLLPEVKFGLDGRRQHQMRGTDFNQDDGNNSERTSTTFSTRLSASYEVDFWGGKVAARDSALLDLDASQYDRETVELTLLSGVADSYLQSLALAEQVRIAQLNLANARDVLRLVQTRYDSGSATALELAQQRSLVAGQARQVPLFEQQLQEARITLATLLGEPVQELAPIQESLHAVRWPEIGSGVPSQLLARRPDIAAAEARLAAAQANVQVARAAMLPSLTLGADLGSGAETFSQILRSPYYALTAGVAAPIFNNGRLRAERDKASARQEELLQDYRSSIVAGFADVEKALNGISGVDEQRQWQDQEVEQARTAFTLSESRYQVGAETLLTVLETQRTLYQAQDQQVQLRLARLQGSVALYKALGGGWQVSR
ncbi:efflux transporter outer membrane subunit [Pseudomonas auratipiscis]|uniref:Efflux transporter outer membrane subunit n=1 Tax=Pseudomonas auratipiscis TaxID=3115853 RepID=A0AB35WQZ1_9PSED|nr:MULTISPECIES: efflux transporter outer membrane subunit [unclassified Pseudomonas]MEE1866565.1 efflux transporter outer membrane subunit [Pseudomonas sp. 120P]MEE1957340.1 efflux transporter outer membrane subunit [Pseudomonas sp. 119P]